MAFGVCLLRSGQWDGWEGKWVGALALDAVTVVALTVLGGLLLRGAMNSSVSHLSVGLACGGLSLGVLILLADGSCVWTTFCLRYERKKKCKILAPARMPEEVVTAMAADIEPQPLLERYRREVFAAKHEEISEKIANDASAVPAHQVLGKLYLGNFKTLVGDAQNDFDTIISVCTLANLREEYDKKIDYSWIRIVLSKNNSLWLHLKSIGDHELFWWQLVHDCTYPDSPLAEREILEEDFLREPHSYRRKNEAIEETAVVDWFEAMFQQMDAGIYNQKRVLVHCFAGRSRSTALVMAYLINRLGATAEQARDFVQKQRPCAKTAFMAPLRQYERLLRQARSLGTHSRDFKHTVTLSWS